MARLTQNLTDIEYTLGSLTFSLEELAAIFQYGESQIIKSALPYWGLVHGSINLINTFNSLYNYDSSAKEKGTKAFLNLFSSAQLGYLSYQSLTAGATNLMPFYTGFAVTAFIDWSMALYDYRKAYRNEERSKDPRNDDVVDTSDRLFEKETEKKLNSLIVKSLTAIGWTMLTFGNPIGWFVIAAGAILTIYFAAINTPSALRSRGLFASCFDKEHEKGLGGRPGSEQEQEPRGDFPISDAFASPHV